MPQQELETIVSINRGRYYLGKGRAEAAEDAFRQALAKDAAHAGIYNDLAYSLAQQQRYLEAEETYRKALALSPKNIVIMGNLAQLLYETARIEQAIAQYDEIIDIYNKTRPEVLRNIVGMAIPEDELSQCYRNKAVCYYALGRFDEALCYSALAAAKSSDIDQTGQHARMLLSLDRIAEALSTLRNVVLAQQANVPPKILLDYAIVLYVTGDKGLAKAAVSKFLGLSKASRSDLRTARLIKLQLALDEKSNKDAEFIRETLFEEEKDFCKLNTLDPDNYWPLAFADSMNSLRDKLCDERDKPVE